MLRFCNKTSPPLHRQPRDPLWRLPSGSRRNCFKSAITRQVAPGLTGIVQPVKTYTALIEDPNPDGAIPEEAPSYKPAARMPDDLDWR